jgi:hypothetical protein
MLPGRYIAPPSPFSSSKFEALIAESEPLACVRPELITG